MNNFLTSKNNTEKLG